MNNGVRTLKRARVLHLGAGRRLDSRFQEDSSYLYITNDIEPLEGINWPYNLDLHPWPFPDNYFEHIIAIDILEHLTDTKKSLEECYRCLALDGIIEVQVPFFGSLAHATDMTHKRGFTPNSFGFFIPGHPYHTSQPWYTHAKFICIKYQLDLQDMNMFEVPSKWRSAMLEHRTVGNIQMTLKKV